MADVSLQTRLNPLAEKLKLRLDEDQLMNCMRCGFCLPACPTFRETGIEAESPRGRIALMKAVADGIMSPDEVFEEQMNHCLGCRACEPACPADVKYGQLIEQARDAIEDHTEQHRWWVKLARGAAFELMFPNQNRMRWLGKGIRFYQKSGLRTLARGIGVMKLLPKPMRDMEKIMPDASSHGVVEQIGTRHPAKGEKIATVGLFRGCIMDVLFTETNIHTVELLMEAGFEVVIPDTQNCCGALHAHSGEAEGARALARRNIQVFKDAGVDYIISNAGGCGAILTEYDHLLHEDPEWKEGAAWFAERVLDCSDLLVRYGRLPGFSEDESKKPVKDSEPVRITYQDSCHLRNVMRSSDAPRRLMRQVAGVEYVEMMEADRCCGSAGIYNLVQPEMAGQILDHKMEHVKTTEAHYLLTSNPGCLLQMKNGIEQHGLSDRMKAVHIVDFLHERMCSGCGSK
ncbi:(Fe-S)-binding protein [Paenibacillus abyssi]|uniref:Glycolate oxidase iron-sulfur subunit n=1 Tax=Paenibacillus abyssi TaxID=1340531 RepID=A0A917D0U6_9BACL|nr:(Fe-S)-binding protein [Paenibacillus abyssi]GGG06203.1 glycolate oxidase iron-sulfur subunit [Paenibacillus abyssi]